MFTEIVCSTDEMHGLRNMQSDRLQSCTLQPAKVLAITDCRKSIVDILELHE